METRKQLQARTRKELVGFARRRQIPGRRTMKKAELVDALLTAGKARQAPRPAARRAAARHRTRLASNGTADQLTARATSPYWLTVRWNLSSEMLARAESALGTDWHQAEPVLRLFAVSGDDGTSASETLLEDVEVETDACEWCVRVECPGSTYRLQLGYRARGGGFFALAHSAPVTTAEPGTLAASDSAATVPLSRNGGGDLDTVQFLVETDLVVHGRTDPHSLVDLEGTPVPVDKDGRFEVRFRLENGRRFLPAVARTSDGRCEQTVALSVERHLKSLEPRVVDEI